MRLTLYNLRKTKEAICLWITDEQEDRKRNPLVSRSREMGFNGENHLCIFTSKEKNIYEHQFICFTTDFFFSKELK